MNEWFDRPMRWAQLTLVENDPIQYDVNFWLDFFKRAHCDAVCLSAGGTVAYYPTRIPLYHRSSFLGDRDCFGELYKGCRELGMNVIARTDPHAVHDDVYAAHPDWIMVNTEGNPVRTGRTPTYGFKTRGRVRRHWCGSGQFDVARLARSLPTLAGTRPPCR
jgi:hypothetical protein